MQDVSGSASAEAGGQISTGAPSTAATAGAAEDLSRRAGDVVSTHVLVPETEADKLRLLSRKTRVAQSEYLREAVDDLLVKYDRIASKDGNS